MRTAFRGMGVAVITPFNSNGGVDFAALQRILEHLISNGTDYLVIQGTTGEQVTLTESEKRAVLDFAIEINNKRLPLVYGVGGNNTQEILETLQEFNFDGVDAILSVSPYYNKPTQEGIFRHYKAIDAVTPRPIILYNVPGRTGRNMQAETTLRIARECKNMIGIKEASGDLIQCLEIKASTSDDFLLISGDDLLTPAMISMGAVGAISVLANAYPAVFGQMVRLALEGQFTKSHELAQKMLPLNRLMYQEGNPTGVKALLQALGLSAPYVRAPMAEASAELKNNISKNLIK